jgi:hypothetical protein
MKLVLVDKKTQSIKYVNNMNNKPKIDALKGAIQKYNKGEIKKDELQAIAKAAGRKVDIWDKRTQRHPNYPVGDQRSRIGFTYDPKHPKGKFFEKVIKKVTWKSIEYIYKKMLKYDEDIFVYDDNRLNEVLDFSNAFIDRQASHSPQRSVLYRKVIGICLALMKEDLRYRSLIFSAYNEMVKINKHFELTEGEKDNLRRWK